MLSSVLQKNRNPAEERIKDIFGISMQEKIRVLKAHFDKKRHDKQSGYIVHEIKLRPCDIQTIYGYKKGLFKEPSPRKIFKVKNKLHLDDSSYNPMTQPQACNMTFLPQFVIHQSAYTRVYSRPTSTKRPSQSNWKTRPVTANK